MPIENALVLNLLRFHQELLPLTDFDFPGNKLADLRITEKELAMADKLVDSMAVDWQPEQYKDDYRERLHGIDDRRLEPKENVVHEDKEAEEFSENAATNVVDFMALLKKSLPGERGRNKAGSKATAAKRPQTATRTSAKAKAKTESAPRTAAKAKRKRK
jgi:DNA end-binding protein Ku